MRKIQRFILEFDVAIRHQVKMLTRQLDIQIWCSEEVSELEI